MMEFCKVIDALGMGEAAKAGIYVSQLFKIGQWTDTKFVLHEVRVKMQP
jgi:hypothetical protein